MDLKKVIKTILFSLVLDVTAAFGAPEGGEVVEGAARIEGENSRNLTVKQSSNKAIINWRTFNEAPDESVTFQTPGADSVTLNRVTGGSASDIEGHLNSNGQVWIINPNGVMFGASAQVNVAGLMASTLDISNEDFKKGDYTFKQTQDAAAKVVNAGHINADNGYVALLAPEVENSGVVSAKLGTVALAAGTEATVTFSGNQLLSIAIPENAGVKTHGSKAPITQTGLLQADGGQVLLNSESVNTLLDESINMSGVIKADTVQNAEGKIILTSSHNVMVDEGTLTTRGNAEGEKGGEVDVIGGKVALQNHTAIDTSGDAGGGVIRVGRYEDRDHKVTEADYTNIDPTVSLQANAIRRGNGGFIETSGNVLNEESSHINTLGAGDGKAGMWLLDPYNLTISANADSNVSNNSPFQPSGSSSNLNTATLTTALQNGNVLVETGNDQGLGSGDIDVNGDINSNSSHSLTLNAAGNININNSITTVDGDVTIYAVGDINQSVDSSIITGSDSTWGNVAIHAGMGAGVSSGSGVGPGALSSAGIIEGNVINIDSGSNGTGDMSNSTGDITQSGTWISHDTGTTGISIINYGTGNVIQTTTGSMSLAFPDSPTTDLGIALTAFHGNIEQAGVLDAKQSHATLSAQEGDFITQDDGSGHLGTITAGSTAILGQSGAPVTLAGNNNLGAITIAAAGDVTANNNNGLVLDDISADNVSVTTGSSITVSGAISVSGALTLNATHGAITENNSDASIAATTTNLTAGTSVDDTSSYIDLSSDSNAFGTLTATTYGKDGSNNSLVINDTNTDGLTIAGLNTQDGNVTLTTSGAVTQTGGMSVLGGGTTTINAGSNDVTLNDANQFSGAINASGNNITLDNVASDGTILGNITAAGNFEGNFFSNVTQASDATMAITGTMAINGESNNVTLNNSSNSFTGAVSITGNDIALKSNANLTLSNIDAAGNVSINSGGTLEFANSTDPTITLRSVNNKTIDLVAEQFNNQNSGVESPIDLGNGSDNKWDFYLSNLSGNTFGNLNSNNQAIWGTHYGDVLPSGASGNRYIFSFSENLTLTPNTIPFTVYKPLYTSGGLPVPQPGTNLQATGFVNASNYGNVFTQDTENNTSLSGLNFASSGAEGFAPIGSYLVNLVGNGRTTTGYDVSYDDHATYGELIVTEPTTNSPVANAAADPGVSATIVATNIENKDANLPNFSGNNAALQDLTKSKCESSGGITTCTIVIPVGVSVDKMPFAKLLTEQQTEKLNQTQTQFERHVKISIDTKTGVVTRLTIKSKDVVVEE